MDYPDHDKVWKLLNTCHLSGAEHEALAEYAVQTREEWAREVDREASTKFLLTSEMADLGICSQAEAEHAEAGYATQLISRVNGILQNWRV